MSTLQTSMSIGDMEKPESRSSNEVVTASISGSSRTAPSFANSNNMHNSLNSLPMEIYPKIYDSKILPQSEPMQLTVDSAYQSEKLVKSNAVGSTKVPSYMKSNAVGSTKVPSYTNDSQSNLDKSLLGKLKPASKGKQECPVCGKNNLSKHMLTVHMRKHTGEKPFQCKECNACFSVKHQLVLHTRKHTGERPYMCSICGSCFMQSNHLQTHMTTHSKEKTIACNLCTKSFKSVHSLRVHQLVHTDNERYACELCKKEFVTNKQLNTHKKVHSSEKPFACDVCFKKFRDEFYIAKHKENFCGNNGYKKRWKNNTTSRVTKKIKVAKTPLKKPAAKTCQMSRAPGRPKGSQNKRKRRKKVKQVTHTTESDAEFEEFLTEGLCKESNCKDELKHLNSDVLLDICDQKNKSSPSTFYGNAIGKSQSNSTHINSNEQSLIQGHQQEKILANNNQFPLHYSPTNNNITPKDHSVNPDMSVQGCSVEAKLFPSKDQSLQSHKQSSGKLIDTSIEQYCSNQQEKVDHLHVQQQKTSHPQLHLDQLQPLPKQNTLLHQQHQEQNLEHQLNSRAAELQHPYQQQKQQHVQVKVPLQHQTQLQLQEHDLHRHKPINSGYQLDRNSSIQHILHMDDQLYDQEHQHPNPYLSLQHSNLDTNALLNYSYSDNMKDLFNLSVLAATYDPTMESQDNAENLSLSHHLPVNENMPQNLSIIPQNLTNLSQNLGSMSDNLNVIPQSLVINQNFLDLPQNLAMVPSQNLSPPPFSSHAHSHSSMIHNLSVHQSNTFSQSVNSQPNNQSNLSVHHFSRLPQINTSLAQNSGNFGTLTQINPSSFLHTINSLPQNLSSSSDSLHSLPQNLTTMAENMPPLVPLVSHNAMPQNLSAHNVASLPQNLSTFSTNMSNGMTHSLPQNLSSHSQFSGSFTQNHNDVSHLSSLHELNIPQNLSSSSSLNQLSARISDEILQPQNLSQSHLSQPENLSMPQNLSAHHDVSERTNQCISQPQNLTVSNNTLTQKEISMPQNLTCGTTLQMPQNLSFDHPPVAVENLANNVNLHHETLNISSSNMRMHELPQHSNIEFTHTSENPICSNQHNQPHTAVSFRQSVGPSGNISVAPNMVNTHRLSGAQNLSNPKVPNHAIQDLSCHSKLAQNTEHMPENLSLASCLDSQPQNLSLPLQPQNLSYGNKSTGNYTDNHLHTQPFIMPQPQNLTLTPNWI